MAIILLILIQCVLKRKMKTSNKIRLISNPCILPMQTINTVSEVIRGNEDNQEYFASVMAPSNPPR